MSLAQTEYGDSGRRAESGSGPGAPGGLRPRPATPQVGACLLPGGAGIEMRAHILARVAPASHLTLRKEQQKCCLT